MVALDPDSLQKPQFSRLAYEVVQTNDTRQHFSLNRTSGVFTAPALSLDTGGDVTMNAFYFLVGVCAVGTVADSWPAPFCVRRRHQECPAFDCTPLPLFGLPMQVNVSDAGGLFALVVVELYLSNANVAPVVPGGVCSVPENSPEGTFLTSVIVFDGNPFDRLTSLLYGSLNDNGDVPIVKLVPSGVPRNWSLVVAAGVVDFESNSVRTIGVRVRVVLLRVIAATSHGSTNTGCWHSVIWSWSVFVCVCCGVPRRPLTTACHPRLALGRTPCWYKM